MLPLLSLLSVLAAPAPAPPPAPARAADTVQVEISAIPGLRFNIPRFEAAPGAIVKLVFRNADSQADMSHNLVITRPGAREKVVQAALQATAQQQYVPSIPEVLFHTPLVEQGDSFTLTFTAPTAAGVYPYACTFPGHGFVMYGAMYVGTPLPPLGGDENVPPTQRVARRQRGGRPDQPPAIHQAVSFGTTLPAVSRTFLPESGPASIAVALPGGQSYDFDAGVSYLRYAWSGGFVDNFPHWRGNGNAYADVLGEVWYRSKVHFPWRVGASDSLPEVRFKGYRLVDGGYPEFSYTVGGAEVRELVKPRSGGPGIVRTFEIQTDQPLRFVTDPEGGARFAASAGQMQGKVLTLSPAQARHFTLTMTPSAEGTR
jgi:azurin